MRLGLYLAVVVAATVTVAASEGRGPRPLLALQVGSGPIEAPSHLVPVDPATLEPMGVGLRLPGWPFGFEAAWSPTGDAVAVVPKPDESTERLHLVDAATLRLRGRVALGGNDVCALGWPAQRTILALAGEHGCYNGQRRLLALRIDPVAKRIVSRVAVPVDWSVDAVATVPGGVAAVVRNTLVVFTIGGVRSAKLPFASAAAAIVSGTRGRIFVAGFDGSVATWTLDGRVAVHRWRSTAAVSKGNTPTVSAAWLGGETLAIGRGRLRGPRNLPLGARLVDTRTWRSRILDASALGVARAGDRVVAYGRDGLRLSTRDGQLVLRALRGADIRFVRVRGRYVYAVEEASADVVDLLSGRETRGADSNIVYGLVLP
jgi:hypothetical protein